MPARQPSASGNCDGWPHSASPSSARRIRLRRKPETPPFPQVLPGSSSKAVPGPTPAEPESCLDQEPVFLSSMTCIAISQTLNVILLHELFTQLFLVGRCFIRHVEHLLARAHELLGIAMTFQAPIHVERVLFVH